MREQDVRLLAQTSGLSERGVTRLLASVSLPGRTVKPSTPCETSAEAPSALGRNVGLRLQELSARRGFAQGISPEALEQLGQVLREYHACCPRVTEWVGRGDFKPDRPIEGVEEAMIAHAVRTAGRLRAKILRHFGE